MNDMADPQMDAAGLYKEETYTDRKVGSITKLVPVDGLGELDSSRESFFLGSTQVMTPAGALPLNFEIEAASLGEAAEKFSALAKVSMEETLKELQELQREKASSIVVPGQGGAGIQLP